MLRWRNTSAIALLLATVAALAACGGSPTESLPRAGTANLEVSDSTGTHGLNGLRAAFCVYNVGPTAADSALVIGLSRDSSVHLELFQSLGAMGDVPSAGTYPARGDGATGSTVLVDARLPDASGSIARVLPVGGTSSIIFTRTRPDTIWGSVVLYLGPYGSSVVTATASGTFIATRVSTCADVPPLYGSQTETSPAGAARNRLRAF